MRIQDHKLNEIKWKLNWDTPPYLLDREDLLDIITELEELRERCADWESMHLNGGYSDNEY